MPTPSEFKSNFFLLFIKGSRAHRFCVCFQSTAFMTGREFPFLTDNGTRSSRIIPSPHHPLLSAGFRELHPLLPSNSIFLVWYAEFASLTIYWAWLLVWNIPWQTAAICMACEDWQSKFFQVVHANVQNDKPRLFCQTVWSKGKSPND